MEEHVTTVLVWYISVQMMMLQGAMWVQWGWKLDVTKRQRKALIT
jgi:hypothetical protein